MASKTSAPIATKAAPQQKGGKPSVVAQKPVPKKSVTGKPSVVAQKPVAGKPSVVAQKPVPKKSVTGKPVPGKPSIPAEGATNQAKNQSGPKKSSAPASTKHKPGTGEESGAESDGVPNSPPLLSRKKSADEDESDEENGEDRPRSMSRYGTLYQDPESNQNDFADFEDNSAIPQYFMDEIFSELHVDVASVSDGSYESISEGGTVHKRHRKTGRIHYFGEEGGEFDEDEEDLGPHRVSVPDVEGGIPKAKLKLMNIQKLQSIHRKIDVEIEFLQTENFILERTVQKMEKRELEIEAAMPAFTYQFPWEKDEDLKKKHEAQTLQNCEDKLSSDEENETGVYDPILAADEIDFDDPYFDSYTDEMKEAALAQIQAVAPKNFDIVRHTYGSFVKPRASDKITDAEAEALMADGEENAPGKHGTPSASQAMLLNKGMELAVEQIEDEDPEFPGFVMKQAKKLPIGEKLKYAIVEEESLRNEFFDQETKGIQQENAIQVYIDTYMNSVELIRKLQELFKDTISDAYHPLTNRIQAEAIVRFRKQMRNRLLFEETKLAVALNELKKTKKKVDEQLRNNRELGESIQLIDYEQLRIENQQFQGDLDDEHETLKNLKIITASCFQQLKDHRTRLQKKILQYKHIYDDVLVRGALSEGFEDNREKFTGLANALEGHNDFLAKRLKLFKAPSTLDYMYQKTEQYASQREVRQLQRKLESQHLILGEARRKVARLEKLVPPRDIRKLNKEWLEEVKNEVETKGLFSCLDDEGDPMGGSMRTFFAKRGFVTKPPAPPRGPPKKKSSFGKKFSDTPSKFDLAILKLDSAESAMELVRKSQHSLLSGSRPDLNENEGLMLDGMRVPSFARSEVPSGLRKLPKPTGASPEEEEDIQIVKRSPPLDRKSIMERKYQRKSEEEESEGRVMSGESELKTPEQPERKTPEEPERKSPEQEANKTRKYSDKSQGKSPQQQGTKIRTPPEQPARKSPDAGSVLRKSPEAPVRKSPEQLGVKSPTKSVRTSPEQFDTKSLTKSVRTSPEQFDTKSLTKSVRLSPDEPTPSVKPPGSGSQELNMKRTVSQRSIRQTIKEKEAQRQSITGPTRRKTLAEIKDDLASAKRKGVHLAGNIETDF